MNHLKEQAQKFRSEKDYSITQLIDGKSNFNVEGVDRFRKEVRFDSSGKNYAVVAIMGPQSSGKSTLLNHLFRTKFREMNAEDGRSQTTHGIWMAKCVGIDPFTIAMDLEGSDGRERGQDDTAFEKQSALFALAIADILLINMWCHEIGREQAANKPLLRTIFQAMMRLFGHNRRTTLLFVLRDKSKTPLDKLKPVLLEDLHKMWDETPKREAHKNTDITEIFRVEIVALSSYEREEDKFKEEVAELRKRFLNSISAGGLAADRRDVEPASAFSINAQGIWKIIKEDRDLDLPSHKVMLANVRCEQILNQKLEELTHNEGWLKLREAVETGPDRPVKGLGTMLSKILDTSLSEYDSDSMDFDETVRSSKRDILKSKVLDVLYPAFTAMLQYKRSEIFEEFRGKLNEKIKNGEEFFESVRILTEFCICEFDQGRTDAGIKIAHWDASPIRDKLRTDIEAHANSIYNQNIIMDLRDINTQQQEKSQEQINKIIAMNEKIQKAAQEQIDRLLELRKKDQNQLERLVDVRNKDQTEAKAQYDRLQASLETYQMELDARNKWGPFYFIRQLFQAFVEDSSD